MTLVELFNHTYPKIQVTANRITQRRNVSQASDLINSTFIQVNAVPIYPVEPDQFVKWFTKCMKNVYVWPNSQFNTTNALIKSADHKDQADPSALLQIELSVENTTEATKEFIEVSSSMTKERASQYLKVLEFKKSLPLHEQVLFELYYEKELSTRKISEYLNQEPGYSMTKDRINDMVNSIKRKLKEVKWK